jgi:hypothetical protein
MKRTTISPIRLTSLDCGGRGGAEEVEASVYIDTQKLDPSSRVNMSR